MKKVIVFAGLLVLGTTMFAQKSIDALFDKYAGKDGFTTVTINGSLLKLAACLGDEGANDSMPGDITELRILTQEDKTIQAGNFYDLVIKDIDLSLYEEFMRVKESNQDLRMLVRAEGKMFKEFLLIGGGEDNVLIQIKGNMSMDEAKKFSGDVKKNHGADILSNN